MPFKSKEEMRGYIRGFMDGEGTVTGLLPGSYRGSRRIAASNTDYNLLAYLSECLVVFGIRSRIYARKKPVCTRWQQAWDLVIFGKRNIETYAREIGFVSEHKRQKLQEILDSYKDQRDVPSEDEVRRCYLEEGLSYTQLMERWGYKSTAAIKYLLRKYGIKSRTYTEAGLLWWQRRDNRRGGKFIHVPVPVKGAS